MHLMSTLAGAAAAAAAWIFNRLALKIFGPPVIIYIVPLVEELAKTGLAVLFNASIIMVHVSFGLIEGIYDFFYTVGEYKRSCGIKKANAGTSCQRSLFNARKTGLSAGLVSLAGHLLYGLVTAWAFTQSGQIAVGVAGGYLVHMLWNLVVMRFLVHKKEC